MANAIDIARQKHIRVDNYGFALVYNPFSLNPAKSPTRKPPTRKPK